jgi:hypothetical protein
MTKLHKPVTREVVRANETPLVVTLTADGLQLREKGRRTRYLLPYGYAFVRAASLEADRRRRDKQRHTRRAKVSRGLLTT